VTKYLVFVVVVFILAGCAPDPRDEAEAYAIQEQANQDAADREQERQQEQDLHQLRRAAWQRFYTVLGIAGSVAVSVSLVGLGIGIAIAAVYSGRAAGRAVEVRANLIPLAETTRQFPLFVQNKGRGLFTAYNPNTGAIIPLHIARREDRQLITASGAVQIAGAIAREARLSNDPAGIAIINPPLVTVECEAK